MQQIDQKPIISTGKACLFVVTLVLITIAAYFGVWEFDFVDYDDQGYTYQNPNVMRGIDWNTVPWAFTYINGPHWIPITWISFALDAELFNSWAGGFHLTNLVLHICNVVLLWLCLRSMTGSVWRSAFIAVLFAIHPLRVESVAWVAERKDVLSGLFFMLTLLTYSNFVRLGGFGFGWQGDKRRKRWYGLMLLAFTFGLLSKPMLVSMPLLLLLLDFWPFCRIQFSFNENNLEVLKRLAMEKFPLLILALIVSCVTYFAQMNNAVSSEILSLPVRIANAMIAYVEYLKQTFWPVNLAVFYPPKQMNLLEVSCLMAVLVLVLITVVAVVTAKKCPSVLVGWLWYLGVLFPVSGIVQAGTMVQADHLTYLPSIGKFIAIIWPLASLVAASPRLKIPLATIAIAMVVALGITSHRQLAVWRNTETLFTHAAKVTKDNYVALTTLASMHLDHGNVADALTNLNQVFAISPKYPRANYLMAVVLQKQGQMQEAIPYLQKSGGPEVLIPGKARMVLSLMDAGRITEADTIINEMAGMCPGSAELALLKAAVLKESGNAVQAAELFRALTAQFTPPLGDNPVMNFQVGELYGLIGQSRKAVDYYSKAVEMSPNSIQALNNYAWILATDSDEDVRNGDKAVELATRACELTSWKQPILMGTLGAAYAEVERFDDAVKMAERARDLAQMMQSHDVAKRNAELIELYRAGKPCRESRN